MRQLVPPRNPPGHNGGWVDGRKRFVAEESFAGQKGCLAAIEVVGPSEQTHPQIAEDQRHSQDATDASVRPRAVRSLGGEIGTVGQKDRLE